MRALEITLQMDDRQLPPGIEQIVLPIRSIRDRDMRVNAWAASDAAGRIALFDTGARSAECIEIWDDWFEGRPAAKVSDIFCTHSHSDHVGGTRYFQGRFGARIHLSRNERDYELARAARSVDEDRISRQLIVHRAGAVMDMARLQKLSRAWHSELQIPSSCAVIDEALQIPAGGRVWQTISGGGHSPWALCFLDAQNELIVLGDQILPDLHPFVGVDIWNPDKDTLGAYFSFLDKVANLPEDTLGLPGHGAPFKGVARRALQHGQSYQRRMARTLDACAHPIRCIDAMPVLFGNHASDGTQFIMIQTAMAIFNYLFAQGLVRRWSEDGIYFFERV